MVIKGRTHYEATLDTDYAVCIADLHARLFGRIKRAIAFVGLIGGSAAIYSLIARDPTVAGIYGVFVALLSAFDLVYDPGGMAAAHQRDKQAFLGLRGRLDKLMLPSIDAELAKIRQGAASCIRSLERPAYRRNLKSHGHNVDHIKLSRFERFFDSLA